jgi:serine/threonine-protein kinase
VHDSGEHDGMPFIVMERLTGESLADKIASGPLPQPLVRSVLDGVLSALAVAHDGGILHRDIKPGNILFTASGDVKVSDFGIAKTAQNNLTAAGQIFGTMAYLSPQRVLGKPATAADDLYAVGVVGYEALTGRPPFARENIAALAQAILQEIPPPIAALRLDVDPALAAVCERAMARDPAVRFQGATAMRAALAGRAPAFHRTRVLDAPVPPPISVAPLSLLERPSRRNKLLALGAVVAAILLAVIILAFDSAQSGPPPEPVTTSTTLPLPTTSAITTPSTVASTVVEAPKKPLGPPGRKPGKHGPGRGND